MSIIRFADEELIFLVWFSLKVGHCLEAMTSWVVHLVDYSFQVWKHLCVEERVCCFPQAIPVHNACLPKSTATLLRTVSNLGSFEEAVPQRREGNFPFRIGGAGIPWPFELNKKQRWSIFHKPYTPRSHPCFPQTELISSTTCMELHIIQVLFQLFKVDCCWATGHFWVNLYVNEVKY